MKVEVAVLGSPSLIILTVSVDVKQHRTEPEEVGKKGNIVPRKIKTSVGRSTPVYLCFFFLFAI